MRGAAIALLVTAVGCSAPLDDELGVSEQPITQSIGLPFPSGHTWYICQSYVGFSHKSNRPFDIGWTKASCNAGNNDSGGRPIAAPGAGRISRMPNTAAGGDFMCLSLTGGGSIVLGHVKPAAGIALGAVVTAGQLVATVRTSTDPAGQNAGIAHLHYEAFSGDNCYVGTAQAFTGAWRMKCAPDLPYNATANHYNGTAITACAPVVDAGTDTAVPKDIGVAPTDSGTSVTDASDAETTPVDAPSDAAVGDDASTPDAGNDTAPVEDHPEAATGDFTGCGCHAADRGSLPWWSSLVLAGAFARRRARNRAW